MVANVKTIDIDKTQTCLTTVIQPIFNELFPTCQLIVFLAFKYSDLMVNLELSSDA